MSECSELEQTRISAWYIITKPYDAVHVQSFMKTYCNWVIILFTVAAVDLNRRFEQRDLEKLKSGANLCVYKKLEQHATDLKTKVGIENPSEDEIFCRIAQGTVHASLACKIVNKWIKISNPSIEPTWKNLIRILEEFGEKVFANELRHYLTTPECVTAKETNLEEESK